MTGLLRAEDLTAGYGRTPVLRSISLHVDQGEVVTLLGANGAGKSTTLLALSGELAQASGTVYWKGNVTREPLHRRARNGLAFVTEERSVFMNLTCEQNLRLGRGGVRKAVALVPQLEPLLGRKAGLLSGGEQQYLTLARALAVEPDLLLADELSMGLAPLLARHLLDTVRAAADRGAGVLLVEQHIGQALRIADRVYVMQRGRVALEGTAAEIAARMDEIESSYLDSIGPHQR
jgi:branched-chain amino acid transport system ATP-binding protein